MFARAGELGANDIGRTSNFLVFEAYSRTLMSRLNNKAKDAIILVQQRLHMDDLAGYVDALDDWVTLRLPAMAEENILIPIGQGRFHARSAGEILHPEREPLAVLESLKLALGSTTFSAQYQHARCRPMARS